MKSWVTFEHNVGVVVNETVYLENQLCGAGEEEHVVVDELLVAVVGRQRQDLRSLPPPLVLSCHRQSTSVQMVLLCWPKTVVKGCVIRAFNHATFDQVFFGP